MKLKSHFEPLSPDDLPGAMRDDEDRDEQEKAHKQYNDELSGKFDLVPLGERILVQRLSEDRIGLVHVPDVHKKTSLRGKILAVGPDCDWVEVDDEIFFGRYATFALPLEDVGHDRPKEILIMNEADVLCKIMKEK